MRRIIYFFLLCAVFAQAQPTPTGNTRVRVFDGNNSWIPTLNELLSGRTGPDSTWLKYSGSYLNRRITDNVYRYGTTSLRSTDTSGVLNIYGQAHPKAGIYSRYSDASTNGYLFFQLDPDNQSNNSTLGNFNFWATNFTGANTPYSSRANHVWRFGYNTGQAGTRVLSTDADIHIAFESMFYNVFTTGRRKRSWEFHVQSQDTLNGVHRLISGIGSHDGKDGEIAFAANRVAFIPYNAASTWMDFDYANKSTYIDTMRLYYNKPQVGYPFMSFRNAANSAYIKMFQADANNRLVINPDANDLYTYAPNLVFNTLGTITTADANAVQIGNSSLKSYLSIYGPAAQVLQLRSNNGGANLWSTYVNSDNIAYALPSGSYYLNFYTNSTYITGYNDRIGIGTTPSARFHVRQNGNAGGNGFQLTNSDASFSFSQAVNANGDFIWYHNAGSQRAILTQSGSLGLMTSGTPARTLQVSGEARITDLVTDTPTQIVGADGDGDLGAISIGSGLSLSGGTLTATAGGVGGTGAANQVAYWTGTSTLAGSSNLTWDGSTQTVTGKGVYAIGGSFGATSIGVDMSGNMSSTANSVGLYALRNSAIFSNDGTKTGNNFRGIYVPTTTSGSTSGSHNAIFVEPVNSSPNVSSLYGYYGLVTESSTSGNLGSRYGAFLSVDKSNNDSTKHTGIGVLGRIRDQSTSGRWATAYGLQSELTNAQNGYGVYVSTLNSRSTANNAYGMRVSSVVSGSGVTATDVVGVELAHSETSSGAITNYYGVRSTSTPAADNNWWTYFSQAGWKGFVNGSLGLGPAASSPARTLHVDGEARITDLVTDTPTQIVGADGDGDLGAMALSSELTISAGTLKLAQQAAVSGQVLEWNGSAWAPATDDTGGGGVTDHGALTGLADDDHTQYLLLAGRSGGQIATGGTASGDDLTLRSTTNATKGDIILADQGGNIIVGGAATESAMRYMEPSGSGSNYTELKAGAMSANQSYIWPVDAPASGESLKWTTGGQLAWEPNYYQTLADGSGNATPRARFRFIGNSEVGVTLTDDVVDQETEIQFNIPTDGIGEPEIAAGAVGSSEVSDNSLAAGDLAVDVVSSVDGVTNDGGNVDFVAGENMTVTPDDASNNVTFAALSGSASPTQITSDQDNYNPTNWSTATTIRVSGDATIRAITSFAALADGTVRRLVNVGTTALYIPAEHPDGTAANRVAGSCDQVLAPNGGMIEMYYDGTSSRWRVVYNTFNPAAMMMAGVTGHYYNVSAGATVAADWGDLGLGTASGGNGQVAPTSSLPGAWNINTSTSASGVATLYYADGVTNPVELGSAHIVTSCHVYLPTLSDGTNTYTFQFGLIPTPTSTTLNVNNSVGIRYTNGTNSGKWQGFSRDNAGTESTADLGITVAANTNYVLTVCYDKARSEARFYVNGAYAGRVTGNMPTATDAGTRAGIYKSLGATSRSAAIASLMLYTVY